MTPGETVFGLLTAAGSGTRLGAGGPKALATLGGRTLFEWALRAMVSGFSFQAIAVTTPPGATAQFTQIAQCLNGGLPVPRLIFVPGGATRQSSVYAGLLALRENYPQLARPSSPEGTNFVLVHDAARAFTPPEVFTRVVTALRQGAEAVTPVLPSADTIKKVHLGPSSLPGTETVDHTLSRADLRRVQTPQGFNWDVLWQVHTAQANSSHSETESALDDCAMVEATGRAAYCVPGDELSFKITTPWDYRLAQAIITEL